MLLLPYPISQDLFSPTHLRQNRNPIQHSLPLPRFYLIIWILIVDVNKLGKSKMWLPLLFQLATEQHMVTSYGEVHKHYKCLLIKQNKIFVRFQFVSSNPISTYENQKKKEKLLLIQLFDKLPLFHELLNT